ncbi:putative hydrolase of the HAD superfamily [Allocatelliglobosispora scoriae]|uniref:Putative hydrolase of the HAD superfamily n=1 Tax=Allocatelliglobosispora scoriae TaxID=643052 RepID=A0A841C0H8_9ACTN|nr:HAD family hydrolase [Allocatelliglobosispora scoriae]MBB5873248.1 putative hydrolase of the HAD superfamily [Allocatelliglobosispora scoriae]
MQRLALFDLDNTLVDRDGAFHRWAAAFVAEHALPEGTAEWLVELDEGGYGPKERLFGAARERFGLTATVPELLDDFRRTLPGLIEAFPGARESLLALAEAGWRIGIVTNGHANQLAKMRSTGLDTLVHGWTISGEFGTVKPDRRIFAACAAACGMDPDGGGWMVGDNAAADIEGGRGAGLATIWLHAGREWPLGAARPDHTVADIPEAVALILR